jgi:hypothetical protein
MSVAGGSRGATPLRDLAVTFYALQSMTVELGGIKAKLARERET